MAFALVANVAASSVAGASVTTGAIDTTGANLIVVLVADYGVQSTTLSDSKGNTWTGLTATNSGLNSESKLYYTYGAGISVGSGHTFTGAITVFPSYPTLCVAAFSGALSTDPFDQQNGAFTDGATSLQPGSITPTENGELVIAGMASTITGTVSINSGMTITDQLPYSAGNCFGGALAYIIQTSAAAINPTWSWTGSTDASSRIASFKVGGGSPPATRIKDMIGCGMIPFAR